ncbi:MAG: N-acyl homoserine lactonase family protein [Clostridia bacterium]|nr:N-acyl homoserine lactonase family protein [Clostridia bacterium]
MPQGLRVTAVDCGPFTIDKGILMSLATGKVACPSTVWIIEHPRQGLILFDTGINYQVADPEAAERYWGPGVRDALGCTMKREDAVDAQLKKLGYRLEDVRFVVLSHLHLDHAGGMCHFPNAVHVVQSDELRYAWWPDPWTRPVYCLNDFKDTRGYTFIELDGDADLFGDGTIRLIKTPGHTPGHQAMILRLENRGPVCLAADTSHLKEAYRNFAPMPYDWNLQAYTQSCYRLRLLEQAGIPLYFTHDPADFAEFPHDGQYAD